LGDGSLGLSERAPFDAIVVAAASPGVPRALVEQLGAGGRLVIPTGNPRMQMLCRITKVSEGFSTEALIPCVFVPLVGREGWPSSPAMSA